MAHPKQEQYPVFTYQSYHHAFNHDALQVSFTYHLGSDHQFTHQLEFPHVATEAISKLNPAALDNLVFHLGLIEGFSYWKLAASPTWQINCGSLNEQQQAFWQELLLSGMGEYFYQNQLNWRDPPLVKFQSQGSPSPVAVSGVNLDHPKIGVGIGGGKDSAVMLKMLAGKVDFVNLIISPASPAATALAHTTNQPIYSIRRTLDPQLLVLNRQGFLNGHVPFSASAAFIMLLASQLYELDTILAGNENSSNEATLTWNGRDINHQYSKSLTFESNFRNYCATFLVNPCPYYSLLRPWSELRIAQEFSHLNDYFSIFRSCNRGQKQNRWCETCPKCLFVYLILAPFIEEKILTTQIFSHNLLDQPENLPELEKLLGITPAKPFECVGTRSESQAAFYLARKRYLAAGQPLPRLLVTLQEQVLPMRPNWDQFYQEILSTTHPHLLPDWLQQLLPQQKEF